MLVPPGLVLTNTLGALAFLEKEVKIKAKIRNKSARLPIIMKALIANNMNSYPLYEDGRFVTL